MNATDRQTEKEKEEEIDNDIEESQHTHTRAWKKREREREKIQSVKIHWNKDGRSLLANENVTSGSCYYYIYVIDVSNILLLFLKKYIGVHYTHTNGSAIRVDD